MSEPFLTQAIKCIAFKSFLRTYKVENANILAVYIVDA